MSSAKPAQMSWVIPYLTVADVEKATHFYINCFGFELLSTSPDEKGVLIHAEMRYHDTVIMCGKEGMCEDYPSKTPKNSGVASAICMYVYCENVDDFCHAASQQGATIKLEPMDTFWGDRMCQLLDLDGHLWAFATHQAKE